MMVQWHRWQLSSSPSTTAPESTTEATATAPTSSSPEPVAITAAAPPATSPVPALRPAIRPRRRHQAAPDPTRTRTKSNAAPVNGLVVSQGTRPGTYAGNPLQPNCDTKLLIRDLEQGSRTAAWAKEVGIPAKTVPAFIGGLTPVMLVDDTRVTQSVYKGSGPERQQAVLETGTSVLVDSFGAPRVRCASGSPLLSPIPAADTPDLVGPPWPGFDPANAVVIAPAKEPAATLTLVDPVSDDGFTRPVGSSGAVDGPVAVDMNGDGLVAGGPPPAITTGPCDPFAPRLDLDGQPVDANGDPVAQSCPPLPSGFAIANDAASPSTSASVPAEQTTTLAPTTLAPTTLAPTTLAPTTLAPTTLAPTTLAPTTVASTAALITFAATTAPPLNTRAPTTQAPTTLPPTTQAPTTLAPTTLAPTTTKLPTNIARGGAIASQFPSYPAANGQPDPNLTLDKLFDGSDRTAWFSGGSKRSGTEVEVLTWTAPGPSRIRRIVMRNNANVTGIPTPEQWGFHSVTIEVLNGAQVVFTRTIDLGTPMPFKLDPNVDEALDITGTAVRLTLNGHDNPECGGFSEFEVYA